MNTLTAKTQSGQEIIILANDEKRTYIAKANGKEAEISTGALRVVKGIFCLRLNQYQVKSLLDINISTDAWVKIADPDAEERVKNQDNQWKKEREDILESFRADVLNNRIDIKVVIVGCDFPQAVISTDEREYKGISSFDCCYSLGENIYNAYKYLPNDKQTEGAIITSYVAEKIRERMKIEVACDEKIKNIKNGAIYFTMESAPHDADLSNIILNSPAPSSGSFTLDHRVSESVFNQIKPFARYYSAEYIEDCDMFGSEPGWRFGIEAVRLLAKNHKTYINNILQN